MIFVLILPWLIFARDDVERYLWPSVQSVSALIKRYEGALRFVKASGPDGQEVPDGCSDPGHLSAV